MKVLITGLLVDEGGGELIPPGVLAATSIAVAVPPTRVTASELQALIDDCLLSLIRCLRRREKQ